METKQEGKWYVDGKTMYTLHQIGYKKGLPQLCNKFYATVYPDYANGITDKDAEKVAKLFAAAPELLDALEKLLKSHRQLTFEQNHNINDTPVEVFAQTVINKAKGDTSC